jgi:hypothetical protein
MCTWSCPNFKSTVYPHEDKEESEVDFEVIYACVMLLHVGCAETL